MSCYYAFELIGSSSNAAQEIIRNQVEEQMGTPQIGSNMSFFMKQVIVYIIYLK